MFKKMKRPMIFIVAVFAVIVIGDDETRHALTRSVKKLLKREPKKIEME